MSMWHRILILVPFLLLLAYAGHTQAPAKPIVASGPAPDSSTHNPLKQDTVGKKKFKPSTATIRSALIPGWGQAYNKKYWKIPIIYGALGTTAGIFFYNLKTYKALRKAYLYRLDSDTSNDRLIDPRFSVLSNESIRSYRNEFRQNLDYSVLFFILFWGLNIVDATVDAHLKAFDVSNDLSLRIKPSYNPIGNTSGLTFIFSLKDKKQHRDYTLP
jgi:hypothetical protein